MNTVAKFEKISQHRIYCDFLRQSKDAIIQLPQRSTKGSAGYDFYAPFDIAIPFSASKIIPTGIRCKIKDDWFLALFPRSGHGFKFGIEISNTVGIIDSDYYNAENEGHIMVKITNKDITERQIFKVKQGQAFC